MKLGISHSFPAPAQTPDACEGSMPQAMPFHFSSPVQAAYLTARRMASTNSQTDEKWTAHVGTDSAFAGSAGNAPGGSAPTPGQDKRDST